MSFATEPTTQAKLYCVNHPQTETLLRCNKCGRPMCLRCVQRTPVGYRCKECLGEQRAGYYTATPFDYVIASVIGVVLGGVSAFAMLLLNFGFFSIIIAIFAGPFAGGIISEAIRRLCGKRRGRYLGLAACAAVAFGALVILFLPTLLSQGRFGAALLNLGFWVFLALALSTTFARLRA